MCASDHPVLFKIKLGRTEFPMFQGDITAAKDSLLILRGEALISHGLNSSQKRDAEDMLKKVEDQIKLHRMKRTRSRFRTLLFLGVRRKGLDG
jgi:hypothetical protein